MNTKPLPPARGFTLIEVLAALSVLAIATVGLTGGIIVAVNTTGIAARRTLMVQFAQARLERLVAETRTKIPTAASTIPVDCSKMAVGGAFDPTAAPGTGGWMLDVIDGASGPNPTGGGDDAMWGPILIYDSASNATDNYLANTIATRQNVYTSWIGSGLPAGCGTTTLAPAMAGPQQSSMLCREVHIEPQTVNAVPMLRVWVRVLQVGADWRVNSVTLQEDIAQ